MRTETYYNLDSLKTYKRISKQAARKAYNAGKIVLVAPVNANMNYIFFPGVYIDKIDGDFDKVINAFEYYNCHYELGKYTKFFIEQED